MYQNIIKYKKSRCLLALHSLGAEVHATMSKVRINFLRGYKTPVSSRINRIWNGNIVYKNLAKLKFISKSIFMILHYLGMSAEAQQ